MYSLEMKANYTYFYRNRGPWSWQIRLDLVSWSALWKAEISFFSKTCVSILALIQRALGPLQMWTHVDVQGSSNIIHHSTKIKKYGFTIYRSEKTFILDENGSDLLLEGKEYYWPLTFIGIPFTATTGSVDQCTTRASYQMPVAGAFCDCRAYLELPLGYIEISAPWISGRFCLTEASNKNLRERFHQE